MKKAMNQSLLTLILNGFSILALLLMAYALFVYGGGRSPPKHAKKGGFAFSHNIKTFF